LAQNFRPPKKNQPPDIESPEDVDLKELFEDAMSDVQRLRFKRTAPRRPFEQERLRKTDTEGEAGQLLSEFVRGEADFEWRFHPGHQEGGAERANPSLMKKLRRGGYAIQAEIDLHGYTQEEALIALERFIKDCSNRRLQCVRVIHGKGKGSVSSEGILKKRVPDWLSMKRIARYVVAFSSARPADGGIGATYVLLRRRPLKRSAIKR
jgi:DNA-nicking Smr family endonuclease